MKSSFLSSSVMMALSCMLFTACTGAAPSSNSSSNATGNATGNSSGNSGAARTTSAEELDYNLNSQQAMHDFSKGLNIEIENTYKTRSIEVALCRDVEAPSNFECVFIAQKIAPSSTSMVTLSPEDLEKVVGFSEGKVTFKVRLDAYSRFSLYSGTPNYVVAYDDSNRSARSSAFLGEFVQSLKLTVSRDGRQNIYVKAVSVYATNEAADEI